MRPACTQRRCYSPPSCGEAVENVVDRANGGQIFAPFGAFQRTEQLCKRVFNLEHDFGCQRARRIRGPKHHDSAVLHRTNAFNQRLFLQLIHNVVDLLLGHHRAPHQIDQRDFLLIDDDA